MDDNKIAEDLNNNAGLDKNLTIQLVPLQLCAARIDRLIKVEKKSVLFACVSASLFAGVADWPAWEVLDGGESSRKSVQCDHMHKLRIYSFEVSPYPTL